MGPWQRSIDALLLARYEIRHRLSDRRYKPAASVDARIAACVAEVQCNGLAVVEGFYTPDQCSALREEIDSLLLRYADQVSMDEEGSDRRLFGANRVSEEIAPFFSDAFVTAMLLQYERRVSFSGFTLAARMGFMPGNRGSGGGWHRDRVDRRQVKAILYLCDVDELLGPFQYVERSHRPRAILQGVVRHGFAVGKDSFTDEEVAVFSHTTASEIRTVTGPAGTLVIADTRGVHRGMPLPCDTDRARYALTNYYWCDVAVPPHVAALLVGESHHEE